MGSAGSATWLTLSALSVFVLTIVRKLSFKAIEGSVTAPQGFKAAAVFCDIKRLGTGKGSNKGQKRDLAMIVSDAPAAVAGTFTTNHVCAAPVKLCLEQVKHGAARSIVVNSGNANACTGQQGMRDAEAMAELAACAALGGGMKFRRAKFWSLPRGASACLCRWPMSRRGSRGRAACSDRRRQQRAPRRRSDHDQRHAAKGNRGGISNSAEKQSALGGICKGAGMIQPGMSPTGARPALRSLHATMLCFLTTDAAIEPKALQTAFNEAVAKSFNRITVDGDMSTNDTVLVLANGRAGNPALTARGASDSAIFQAALDHVTLELAKKIVLDGEGVSRFVTVRVRGAKPGGRGRRRAGHRQQHLVKTSWYGGDPNWGRILCALGYSPAANCGEQGGCGLQSAGEPGSPLFAQARPPNGRLIRALCQIRRPKAFDLHINLNLGSGSAMIYAAI